MSDLEYEPNSHQTNRLLQPSQKLPVSIIWRDIPAASWHLRPLLVANMPTSKNTGIKAIRAKVKMLGIFRIRPVVIDTASVSPHAR